MEPFDLSTTQKVIQALRDGSHCGDVSLRLGVPLRVVEFLAAQPSAKGLPVVNPHIRRPV